MDDEGNYHSIPSVVSEWQGNLRLSRIDKRKNRFMANLYHLAYRINPRHYREGRQEGINILLNDYVYFPKLQNKQKTLLVGKVICFIHHFVAKGNRQQQQLFQASTTDDDVWLMVYLIDANGGLSPAPLRFECVSLKLINSNENVVTVVNNTVQAFQPDEFSTLKTLLWGPLDLQEKKKRDAQAARRDQRLNDFTLPADYMNMAELWNECKARLKVHEKKELHDKLLLIEGSLSARIGLNPSSDTVSKARLKLVVKFLRDKKIMYEDETQDSQDDAQVPQEDDQSSQEDAQSSQEFAQVSQEDARVSQEDLPFSQKNSLFSQEDSQDSQPTLSQMEYEERDEEN